MMHPLVYPPLLFSKVLIWQCSYILPLSWLFRKLEGTNNGSLEMGVVLCRYSQHDCRSHCHPVGVTAIFRQWSGHDAPSQHRSSTSCSPWPPLTPIPCRSTTACTQSRTRSAIRIGSTPLVKKSRHCRLFPPPPPPPLSCHPSVKIGGTLTVDYSNEKNHIIQHDVELGVTVADFILNT